MDFIAFLKSGSVGAYWRVTFDGKSFKKENENYPEFVVDDVGNVYKGTTAGISIGYIVEKSHDTISYSYWKVRSKSDGEILYTLEICHPDNYVCLRNKFLGSAINSFDKSDNGKSELSKNNTSTSDDNGTLAGIFALLIPPVVLIRVVYRYYNLDENSRVANIIGCIIGLLTQIFFMNYLKSNNYVATWIFHNVAVYIVHIVYFSITIIALPFAKKIADFIKNDKQLVIGSIIYSLGYILTMLVVFIMHFNAFY